MLLFLAEYANAHYLVKTRLTRRTEICIAVVCRAAHVAMFDPTVKNRRLRSFLDVRAGISH